MIKQKKLIILIFFTIVLILVTLKFFDIFVAKKYGLGKPLIYEKSRILGYKIKPNQNIERRGKNININNLGMRSLNDWKEDRNYKIIFFGDSVTFGGSIVNNSDLFSEIHQPTAINEGHNMKKRRNNAKALDLNLGSTALITD